MYEITTIERFIVVSLSIDQLLHLCAKYMFQFQHHLMIVEYLLGTFLQLLYFLVHGLLMPQFGLMRGLLQPFVFDPLAIIIIVIIIIVIQKTNKENKTNLQKP